MIRLHHLNKSRSLRIMWLLEEIGVDYELVAYHRDATTRLAPPDLKNIHPLGKSPVVEMEGRVIAESAAIVERICLHHAPHMIPDAESASYVDHLELMHFAEGSAMLPPLLGLYTSILGDAAAPLQPRIVSEMDNHFSYMNNLVRPSGHFGPHLLVTLGARRQGRVEVVYHPELVVADYPSRKALAEAAEHSVRGALIASD